MVDVKRLLRAEHDVQKNAAETDVLRISEREGKTNRLHFDQEKILRNVKDAKANDMIHMGSDHRCVMATFLVNMPEKKINVRRENTKHETTVYVEHEEKARNNNIEMSELEKRYQDIIVTLKKKPPPKKKKKHMTQETMQKIPQQLQKQKALLL